MEKTSNCVVRSTDVIGKKVMGNDGDGLGKIEEIVLDKVSGQTRYAVLSFGGFMGMGTDFYTLPWQSLSYCHESNTFKVNIDKDKLKAAKGFDKDHWPDFASESYIKSIHDYYTL